MEVPGSLRQWFVAHFVVSVGLAVPLLVAPVAFLQALGWSVVDPAAARVAGAALLAIGTQSLLSRRAEVDVFRTLLNLKIVWSLAVITGLVVSAGDGAPPAVWVAVSAFLAFAGVWVHHRIRFRQWELGAAHRGHDDDDQPLDEPPPA
jgi:hypothetical protein